MSSGVFRYGAFVDPKVTELKFYQDGKTATISVLDVDRACAPSAPTASPTRA